MSAFYADPYVDAAEQYLTDKAEGVVYFRGVRYRFANVCTCSTDPDRVSHELGCGWVRCGWWSA